MDVHMLMNELTCTYKCIAQLCFYVRSIGDCAECPNCNLESTYIYIYTRDILCTHCTSGNI